MTPEFPSNHPRTELEAKLTAFILGELPAHEAAALRQAMDEDLALADLFERLKGTIKLVRETTVTGIEQTNESPAPLRLSEDRRQKLLAQFKTVAPKEFVPAPRVRRVHITLVELVAVLAIIATLAALMLPALSTAKYKARSVAVRNNLHQIEIAKSMWADDNKKSTGDAPTASDLAPYLNRGNGELTKSIAGETYTIGKVGESPAADFNGRASLGEKNRHMSLDNTYSVGTASPEADADKPIAQFAAAESSGARVRLMQRRLLQTDAKGSPNSASPTRNHDSTVHSASTPPLPPMLPPPTTVAPDVRRGTAASDFPTAPTHLNIVLPPTDDGQYESEVIPVKHAKASEIASALSSLGGNTSATVGSAPADASSASAVGYVTLNEARQQNSVNRYTTPSSLPFDLSTTVTTSGGSGGAGGRATSGSSTVSASANSNEGDPEWIAFLEHPEQRHSTSNSFVARSGFIALPANENLDLNSIHNQTKTPQTLADQHAEFLRNQGIAQAEPASEFRFYHDLNANGATQPTTTTPPAQSDYNKLSVYRNVDRNGSIDPATGLPVPQQSAATPEPILHAGEVDLAQATPEQIRELKALVDNRASNGQLLAGGILAEPRIVTKATTPLPTDTGADVSGDIDGINQSLSQKPPEVNIKAKFADITQNDNRALGFNWNSGKFAIAGGMPIVSGGLPPAGATNPSGVFPGIASSDRLNGRGIVTITGIETVPQFTNVDKAWDTGKFQGGALLGPRPESDFVADNSTLGFVSGTNTPAAGTGAITDSSAGYHFETGTLAAKKERALNEGLLPSQELIERIPEFHTNEVRTATLVQDGKLLFEAGKLDEAEAKLGQAYQQDPGNVAAYQYLRLTKEKQMADAIRRSELHSTEAFAEVETAWDGPTLTRSPNIGYLGQVTNYQNSGAITNLVGYASITNATPLNIVTDSESKKGVAITDEAVRRQSGKVSELQSTRSQAYLTKLQELKQLRETQEQLALKTAQASVESKMPTTLMVEVIEHADGKPAKKTLSERIGNALTGNDTQTARIKVERDVTDVPGISGQSSLPGVYDPNFVQTEFEAIQSEKILDRVIDRLNLKEAWASKKGGGNPLTTAEARQMLKHELQLSPLPNTSILDIKVKSDKPQEAAKIANTIAEVYQNYRRQQREASIEGGLKVFKDGLAEQSKKIARVEDELAQIEKSEKPQADAPIRKPAAPAPIPQPEVATSDNAFSTFSLNIADVSFKLAAASLEKGQMPEPASIRSEEFINAFDYRDPEPAPGAPLGFAWERARYPFAHNRDLLRFSVKTAAAGRTAGQPLNIVLLLDNSGSMERADRVQIIHEALRVLATQLGPQDKISVVTFAHIARLWVDGLSGSHAGEVAQGLSKLTPEGGTNLEEAMRLAYETARRHYLANGINRVVLLTDGAANLGNVNADALKQKVEEHRKEGIALDCFGIGWEGYNDDLLEVLSRHGDGRYGFINTPGEAATGFAKQLAGALHVAAADVKVQVEFNPKRVTSYRQIGYAKHQLTKEQFRDNTVDAAEIGAAESGNALYTIEVNPNGEGPLATVHVRYKVPGTGDYPEHEWVVPYTGGAASLEQSSPAMRLAGTASAFSEMLATSPFAGEVTTDQLLSLMRGVPETYGADERPKKLEWMLRQTKSLEGK